MTDKDHPIWPIIRILAIGVVITLFLHFNYNFMDRRDLVTILGTIGASVAAEFFTKRDKKGNKEDAGSIS